MMLALDQGWVGRLLSLGLSDLEEAFPMLNTAHNAYGLTPKQELFAQLVSRGMNLSEAYRDSHGSKGNVSTVNNAASRLWSRPEMRHRVEMLLKEQEKAMMRDAVEIRRHVFSGLLAESKSMKNKGSERIAALIALGKIDMVGMFRELHGVERTEDRSAADIEQELREKLGVFLEDLRSTR
jgi:hypothetical protein